MSERTPKTQGDYEVGNKKPPKNRQFGQPEGNKQGRGFWKKEATARFKLERMMTLSEAEINAIRDDVDASYFERKLATCISNGDWAELQGMMNQVYGMPKQVNENKNIEIKPILPMKGKK